MTPDPAAAPVDQTLHDRAEALWTVNRGCTCGGVDIGVGTMHHPNCGEPGPDDVADLLREETADLRALVRQLAEALAQINEGADSEPQITLSGEYGSGLSCGVEDIGAQRDGYRAAEYGFREGVDRVLEWAQGIATEALAFVPPELKEPQQ